MPAHGPIEHRFGVRIAGSRIDGNVNFSFRARAHLFANELRQILERDGLSVQVHSPVAANRNSNCVFAHRARLR